MYHVLNRGNGRGTLFEKPADYAAFEAILAEVRSRVALDILAWCLMPNHWHLVVRPCADGELSRFMHLVALTHTHRWQAHRASTGSGHLYQGRFRSFLVQEDEHFLTVCRYVERNALRAGLVARAEAWRWGSLWRLARDSVGGPPIAAWPVPRPRDWVEQVNVPATPAEIAALQACTRRGAPYGTAAWVRTMADELGIASTLRPRGRPPTKKVPGTFFQN